MKWQKEKPSHACVFVGHDRETGKVPESYSLWTFKWVEESGEWYLGWFDEQTGDEYDDITQCNFDEYLVVKVLPTLEELP